METKELLKIENEIHKAYLEPAGISGGVYLGLLGALFETQKMNGFFLKFSKDLSQPEAGSKE